MQRTAIDAAPIPDNGRHRRSRTIRVYLEYRKPKGKNDNQEREIVSRLPVGWFLTAPVRRAGRLSAIHSNAGDLRALAPIGSNFEGKSAMLSVLFWITSRGTRRLLRAGCNGGKRVKLFRRPKPSFIGTTSRCAASATVAQPGKPRQLGPLATLIHAPTATLTGLVSPHNTDLQFRLRRGTSGRSQTPPRGSRSRCWSHRSTPGCRSRCHWFLQERAGT